MTLEQLQKFIRIRNRSGFQGNLQFQIDAKEAGFPVSELGAVARTNSGFEWVTPHGRLIEERGKLRLEVISQQAARELLAALKNIVECAEAGAGGANMDLWIKQARAAIADAEVRS